MNGKTEYMDIQKGRLTDIQAIVGRLPIIKESMSLKGMTCNKSLITPFKAVPIQDVTNVVLMRYQHFLYCCAYP